jgi:Right handed beta helix region
MRRVLTGRAKFGVALGSTAILALFVISVVPSSAGTSPAADRVSLEGQFSAESTGTGGVAAPANSLQSAIGLAPAGSTIHLPPGLFVGQLWVNKSLNIVGSGEGKTILRSPSTMRADPLGNVFVIEIGDHSVVHLSRFTVEVTEQCMLANEIGVATGGGVGVWGNATADIWSIAVFAIGPHPDLDQSCSTNGQAGMLSFGRAISIGLDAPVGVGTATEVEGHGSVRKVQTRGFDIFSISIGGVRGPSGSTATVDGNFVQVGPGPYTAAYGIVAYGRSTIEHNLVTGVPGSDGGIAVVYASAIVMYNTVTNFTCTNAPFPISPPCGVDPLFDDQDLGIFVASATVGTVIEHNTILRVDSGILVEGPGVAPVIAWNYVANSTYYGFEVIDAKQAFRHNTDLGGMYAVAVGAASLNTSVVLFHDRLKGYSVSLALLEANYPWVAKVIVRGH